MSHIYETIFGSISIPQLAAFAEAKEGEQLQFTFVGKN